MHDQRLANLLGAAALAINDVMLAEVHSTGTVSASGASALVTLAQSPGLGVTDLGRRVGLSQSATTRMVDAMEAAGLIRRAPGAGRLVGVSLTPSGHETAGRILAARAGRLTELVSDLDAPEREALTELLVKLLARLYGEIGSADLLCRLCDRGCCTRSAVCPVGQAERDREA